MPRFLERVGLGRPELRAWALYDWANSAWVLTIQTAVFPIYFEKVAAVGFEEGVALQRYGWISSAALVTIALSLFLATTQSTSLRAASTPSMWATRTAE